MKLRAYSLRDLASDTFSSPFFVPSDGIAKRTMTAILADPRSQAAQYPKDFLLYYVGDYETDTGLLSASPVVLVCTASSCLPAPDPRQLLLPAGSSTPTTLAPTVPDLVNGFSENNNG